MIDGIFLGYPYRHDKEWVAVGETSDTWVMLSWPKPIMANRIVLYDRPSLQDNILKANLTFSDGSSIPIKALPKNGSRFSINFSTKTFKWVRLTIDQMEGIAGLAEFEVNNRESNIAPEARVVVSSQNIKTGQLGSKVVDGVVDGYPGDFTKEWASVNAGAWIKLEWQQYYTVSQIILFDRPNLKDNIRKARMVFSDGSTVNIGPLNNAGAPYIVKFGPKKINWVKLEISKATGLNSGLAEFEVYGYPEDPDVFNIAPLSRATASSTRYAHSQPIKAVNGRKTGLANDERITANDPKGAWIKLSWDRTYDLNTIILYDRPNLTENIKASRLQLSDGSIFDIDELPKDGTGQVIDIQKSNIRWIKYIIDDADGPRTGLSDIEVYGKKSIDL